MISSSQVRAPTDRRMAWAAAIIGILLLMWPALVNGVPFVFSDTTAYVRAGDMAAGIASHGHVHTAWSHAAPPPAAVPMPVSPTPSVAAAPAPAPVAARGNDIASGTIMAGRSPYFGLLLWLGYVSSDFWLFVIAQAAIAWWLIGLSLRLVGSDRPGPRLAAAAVLGLGTPLALYDGILLADALAGFGLLAFLLLASGSARIGRSERIALVLLCLVSAVSHLTHIVMLAAMIAVLLGLSVVRGSARWRTPIVIGAAVVAVALASVAVTGAAVKAHFGRAPALIPMITARLIADGPGRAYIESGCDGRRFAVCRIPYRHWESGTVFLWSSEPATGGYLTADAPTRQAMAAEDKSFALAVLRHAPMATIGAMAWNTVRQLTDFHADMFTQSCYAQVGCTGAQFPERMRTTIAHSLGGRELWPALPFTLLHYAVVIGAIAVLAVALPRLSASDRALLGLWIGLLAAAMIANAFFGGAISEPQSRYQARIVWLIPLFAVITVLARRRARLLEAVE